MGFASEWLRERALFQQFIEEAPYNNTGIIVVIPAYNEPAIIQVLNSLAGCRKPACKVEVLIVINAPANAPEEHLRNNRKTISDIESWKKENKNCFFRLFYFVAGNIKGWGVGLARKSGMDEAVRRFNHLENPEGVILCLDADCTVAVNYFEEICNEFYCKKDRKACSVYFEHPSDGKEFPIEIYESIVLYELHLRYYLNGLKFAGYPEVFHTVGSAMAVKALPYIRSGGMNRKQAGEDFYFIQKLIPLGGYFSLNSTTVFPSPRISERVPFGTGASIRKLADTKNGYKTYNLNAFVELNCFFSKLEAFFKCHDEELLQHYFLLPGSVRIFISTDEWIQRITEIRSNTSSFNSFRKRFFAWFNMFRIVKYLNLTHQDHFNKMPVEESAAELLRYMGMEIKSANSSDLLTVYRSFEKGELT